MKYFLWRRYNTGLGVANEVCQYGYVGNNGVGITKKSMIDAFILKMENLFMHPRCVDENSSYWEIIISFISLKQDTRADIFIKNPRTEKICILRQEIMG